jgi:hypothetical protein
MEFSSNLLGVQNGYNFVFVLAFDFDGWRRLLMSIGNLVRSMGSE